VQSVLVPSPCCTRMIAAISHNNTSRKSKDFVAVDEQLAKTQRRIKELGMSKPRSSLLAGFLTDGDAQAGGSPLIRNVSLLGSFFACLSGGK